MTERTDREKKFHNQLAQNEFQSRKLLNVLAESYYDKDIIWDPIWLELGNLEGKRALDYGCGAGIFSLELARRGAKVCGIDVSDELVTLATRNVSAGIYAPEYLCVDAHHTGFSDGSFDFVFGNGILHHLELDQAFAEISRILRPGGKAYFMEPLNGHPLAKLVRWVTPRARSVDEKPMTFKDMDCAKKYFSQVDHTEYFLFSLLCAPFHLIHRKLTKMMVTIVSRVDHGLFRFIPALRQYGWITVLCLKKQGPQNDTL